MPGFVGDILNWIVGLVDTMGYAGLAIVVALENVFPPIPSEVILPLAGFLVGQGRMTLVGAIVASTVGAVVGALILYWFGYALGEDRVRQLIVKYGHWALIDEEDLDRSKNWFVNHGRSAVFIGRLAPLVRSLISIPAGVAKMPVGTFVIFTAAGSGLWNTLLIGAGWALGANWQLVEKYQGYFSTGFVALMGLAVAWFVIRRLMNGGPAKRRAAKEQRSEPSAAN
jgi:membrane protein DedA with SNARE-associated domain